MKTKVLLLGAALAMTTAIASAQTYSSNVVGYVNVDLVPGWNMIANPLSAATNTLELITAPVGSSAYKMVNGAYQIAVRSTDELGDYWDPWDITFEPGEGLFVNIAGTEPVTVTFVGECVVGNHSIDLPAGWSLVGNPIPTAGAIIDGIDTLGLDAVVAPGDAIYLFDATTQGYVNYNRLEDETGGYWDPYDVNLNIPVGQGFFINKSAASTWTRTFEF